MVEDKEVDKEMPDGADDLIAFSGRIRPQPRNSISIANCRRPPASLKRRE
jgi:hypothetical protein